MSVCPCSGRGGSAERGEGVADPGPRRPRAWRQRKELEQDTSSFWVCMGNIANLTSYSSPWAVSKYFLQADARGEHFSWQVITFPGTTSDTSFVLAVSLTLLGEETYSACGRQACLTFQA